jgi:glycosyltransferase involved in cell wall biosynthesis
MIEAMACGTPTIAFNHGSVPELIENGVSGYIVDSVAEAAEAVSRVRSISRAACREAFEKRFTARRMAEDYLRIYGQVSEPQERLLRYSAAADPAVDEEELLEEPAA